MKYFHLIWKNMTRKKVRLTFTFFSIVVAFILYGLLTSLAGVFTGEIRFSADNRLFITAKHGGPLPVSHADRIRNVNGIAADRVVWVAGFAAFYQDEQQLFGVSARNAAESVRSWSVGDRYYFEPEELQNWVNDRSGIIISQRLADEENLQVGDRLPVTSPGFTKADGTNTWEFNVSGIYGYTTDENPREGIIHWENFDQARTTDQGMVGSIANVIDNPDDAERISQEIDAMFANSTYETQTGTEDSLTRDFFRRVGNMGFAIHLILGAVFLTMVLVTANSMIQAFQERVHEIGIMKTLGFTGTAVFSLIVAEALLMLVIGGGIGLAIAWFFVERAKETITVMFYFGPSDIILGVLIIFLVGIVVGGFPALQARNLSITQALGRS